MLVSAFLLRNAYFARNRDRVASASSYVGLRLFAPTMISPRTWAAAQLVGYIIRDERAVAVKIMIICSYLKRQ